MRPSMRSGEPSAFATSTCPRPLNGCGRRSRRLAACTRCELLRDPAADFPAAMLHGVDVDVPAAGHEIGGLLVVEHGGALGGAGRVVGNQDRHRCVLAGFGWAMKVSRCSRTGETGKV